MLNQWTVTKHEDKTMKLNNIAKAILVTATAGGMMIATGSVSAASATATGTATVMQSISITKTADLDFGAFSPSTGGTVVIGTDSSRSKTSAVVLSSSDTGNRAQFNVTGTADATYAITLPGSATLTSGGNTMSVGSFVSDPSGTGTLTGGSEVPNVGATLTVASSQAAGSYTGTFDVTVEYN